jgi:dTDP-glucose 4,6-dehydratase
MNVITTHCSNNYGPHQHDEKLIPTIIRTALANKPIPVYGNGLNVRDWLFVDDHCEALIALFEKGKAGETYNIGGNNEWSNIDLVNEICSLLDDLKPSENQASYKELISFVEDRKGHDFRYAIDASKLKNEIGWQASNDFQAMLKETVQYYLNRFSIGK